jgi:hypothetical protein
MTPCSLNLPARSRRVHISVWRCGVLALTRVRFSGKPRRGDDLKKGDRPVDGWEVEHLTTDDGVLPARRDGNGATMGTVRSTSL